MFCKSSESNLRGLPAPGLLFWTALWSLALLVAKLQVTQPQKTLNMRWLSPVVPQRVLDARISPYSILRHSPSIAIQPNSDPPSFKCGGGHHLLRALEFPSNAQVEGEWRHLELMQKRSREMAERAEMVAKGLIPSASLPSLRVRKIA